MKQEHYIDTNGKKECPDCGEVFDISVSFCKAKRVRKPLIELTKGQFRLAMGVGFSLGMMIIIIWSFIVLINEGTKQMNLEKQIKHDLIQEVKDSCGSIYPVVRASIFRDRMVIECRTE